MTSANVSLKPVTMKDVKRRAWRDYGVRETEYRISFLFRPCSAHGTSMMAITTLTGRHEFCMQCGPHPGSDLKHDGALAPVSRDER